MKHKFRYSSFFHNANMDSFDTLNALKLAKPCEKMARQQNVHMS